MIPWWGWLIISVAGLCALYCVFAFVFSVVVFTFLKDIFRD